LIPLPETTSLRTIVTLTTYIKANKGGYLTLFAGTETISNMNSVDSDPTTGLDGKDSNGDERNEVGFYISAVNTSEFTIGQPWTIPPGIYYDTHYTPIPTTPTLATLLTSAGGYSDESFKVHIGAFVHGLLNDPDDVTVGFPTLYCSPTQGAPCVTKPGDYQATFTITAATTP